MKTIEMQLITIELKNGDRGIFIGTPLVATESVQIKEDIIGVWFSTIQNIPVNVTIKELTQEVNQQIKNSIQSVH